MSVGAQETPGDAAAVAMTEDRVRAECRKRGGYWTPELNEKLYLHHAGFTTIGGLEPFTGCTALYLSHNAISDLAPLVCLPQLRMLHLSHNALQSCASLPPLPELVTLDISHNSLRDLRGVCAETTPVLEHLLAANNQLHTLDASSSLFTLRSLTSLDVSHNQLTTEDDVLPALQCVAAVRDSAFATCDLSGNGLTRTTKAYRKRLVALLSTLRFLDGMPVEQAERARAEAFARGGLAEEARVRAANEASEAVAKQEQFAYLAGLRATVSQKREAEGKRGGPSAYYLAQVDDNETDDIYVPVENRPLNQ